MWQALLDHWRAAGISLRPGVAESKLDEFEREKKVRLPAEMRSFYRECDGMDLGQWDENLMRFWPLGEIENLSVYSALLTGETSVNQIAK